MKKILEDLRNKKQHEKEKIAFLGALISTLLIALFWFAGSSALKSAEDQVANTVSPFESIRESFSDIIGGFKK